MRSDDMCGDDDPHSSREAMVACAALFDATLSSIAICVPALRGEARHRVKHASGDTGGATLNGNGWF